VRHEHRYDAFGRRIEKITDVNGTPTVVRYSYGGNIQQVVERQRGAPFLAGGTIQLSRIAHSRPRTGDGRERRKLISEC